MLGELPNIFYLVIRMKKWERFTRQEIEQFVKESFSYAQLTKKIGYNERSGSSNIQIKEMIEQLDLDISHFKGQGWALGEKLDSKRYIPFEEYIKGDSVQTNKLRRKLLKEGLKEYRCECCQNTIWNNQPIPLEVHHKDGNKDNNELDNLKLLCPNCHALTDNYRGKNTKKHKTKFSN